MAHDGTSRSYATTTRSYQNVIEFDEFLETLDPDIKARYKASHYKLRDEEAPLKRRWKGPHVKRHSHDLNTHFDYQSLNGISPQYDEALILPYKWYKNLRSIFLVSTSPFIHAGVVRGSLGVQHERFLHIVSFPSVVHPYSNFYWLWNFLLCIFLSFSLTYEPYLLAFNLTEFSNSTNIIISFVISLLLLVDTFLTFRVGFRDPVTRKVILDPMEIRRNYLYGKFWFNLLTRFPYDSVMFLFTPPEERVVKTKMTLIRMVAFFIKIMRYEKFHWFLREMTVSLNMKTWTSQISLHGTLVIFCAHWGACLQWFLSDVANAYHYKEHGVYKRNSWITTLDLWDRASDFQYMNAFLRSLATILCLEGGEFCPREYEEIFVTTVLLVLSLSIVSYFISIFSSMVVEFQRGDEQCMELTSYALEYMRFRKIPMWLRERVLAYYDGKYRGHCFPEKEIFETISGSLKNEIRQHNCKHLIRNVYLFSDLSVPVMRNLVQRLTHEVYIPGDVVQSPHIRLNSICFIEEGFFGVMNSFGDCTQLLGHGNFFGEIDLMFPNITRKTSIVALSICNVYKLTRTEYLRCMTMYPEIHDKIMVVANKKLKEHLEQLDQQSERIAHAKRWKEIILSGKRTIKEYYADIDAGLAPVHHIPPSALQDVHFENYTRSMRNGSRTNQASKQKSNSAESDSASTSQHPSRDMSDIWSHSP